jgi:hypothetical protein
LFAQNHKIQYTIRNYTSSMKTFLRLGLTISCVVVVLGVFVIPTSVGAETTLGINGGKSFLDSVAGQTGIDTTTDLQTGTGVIIQRALQIVGSIFLLLMIYAGFLWFVARDDETQAKKAKDTGTMAAIGLIIILLSYAVTSLIINQAKAPDASKAGELGCCMDYIGVEYGYDIGWSCSTKTATECKQTAEVCTEADNYTNFEFNAGATGADCMKLCAEPKKSAPSPLIDCRD